jgi:hypothetical protein
MRTPNLGPRRVRLSRAGARRHADYWDQAHQHRGIWDTFPTYGHTESKRRTVFPIHASFCTAVGAESPQRVQDLLGVHEPSAGGAAITEPKA